MGDKPGTALGCGGSLPPQPPAKTGSVSLAEGTWAQGEFIPRSGFVPPESESPAEGTGCVPTRGALEGSHLSSHRLLGGGSCDLFIRSPTVNPHGWGTSGLACRISWVLCVISRG